MPIPTRRAFAVGRALLIALAYACDGAESISPPEVASVDVSAPTGPVLAGETIVLTGRAFDRGGRLLDVPLSWLSSDTSIAAVNGGMVTGRREGSVVVTASAGGISSDVPVTVRALVAVVSLSAPDAPIAVGATATLSAQVLDASGNALVRTLVWSSSDTSVATVESGVVRGARDGDAVITASVEGRSASVPLNVRSPVAAVTISTAASPIAVGGTATLSARALDPAGHPLVRAVVWSSSDTTVAAVAGGVVRGVDEGDATVTATVEGRSASTGVSVRAPVAAISVSAVSAPLPQGDSLVLATSVTDASGRKLVRTIEWSSSDTAVVSVSAGGVVRGRREGKSSITASAGGRSTSVLVVVWAPVARVVVEAPSTPIVVGTPVTLVAKALDAAGTALDRPLTWATSDTSVATVVAGIVHGVGDGTVSISAAFLTVTGAASVHVRAPVASVVLEGPTTLGEGGTARFVATARDARARTLVGRSVEWGSSDTGLVAIDPSGGVRGVLPGRVKVTARIEGVTASADLTVPLRLVAISAGLGSMCGLSETGSIACWSGQSVVAVRTALKFREVSTSGTHTCAIATGGSTYCWGQNKMGQLGNGGTGTVDAPVAMVGPRNLARLATTLGAEYWDGTHGTSCGIEADGSLNSEVDPLTLVRSYYPNAVCWGSNLGGLLGANLSPDVVPFSVAPKTVGLTSTGPAGHTIGLRFTAIATGSLWTCGIARDVARSEDQLWWNGHPEAGYLWCAGNTTLRGPPFPVLVDMSTDATTRGLPLVAVRKVRMGPTYQCAITEGVPSGPGRSDYTAELSGRVYCWGYYGPWTQSPFSSSNARRFTDLGLGWEHQCALTGDGSVYCVGKNPSGELGDGTTVNSTSVPVRALIPAGLAVESVAVSMHAACAITMPGRVTYCWGGGYGTVPVPLAGQ